MGGLAIMVAAAMAVPAEFPDWLSVPDAEDFRIQHIRKADREADWPFGVEEGYLLCAHVLGERVVFFSTAPGADDDADEFEREVLTLSSNPAEMILLNLGHDGLVAEMATAEEMIRRIAPLVATGKRLCDQPPGSVLPAGEL